jgi:hypothetical protein
MKNDVVARRAFKNPTNWETRCPRCSNHFTVKELIDANAHTKYAVTADILRGSTCWYHPSSFMVLKPIKPTLGDILFLIWAVISGLMTTLRRSDPPHKIKRR